MAERYMHIGRKIDEIFDRLNALWNLRLPQLCEEDIRRIQDPSEATALHCSSRIRYLCHFSEHIIDSSITEFEEDAKYIFSKWIWKPSQERGTLPSTQPSGSALQQDIVSSKSRYISAELREALLQKLSGILDDEYTLARESDQYERVSSQQSTNAASRSTSFTTAATELSHTRSQHGTIASQVQLSSGDITPNKRRKASGETQDGKRSKVLPGTNTHVEPIAPIKDYFRRVRKPIHPPLSDTKSALSSSDTLPDQQGKDQTSDSCSPDVFTSFDSAMSPVQSVFSSFQESDPSSSASTSILYEPDESQDWFPTQDANELYKDDSFVSALNDADKIQPVQFSEPVQPVQPVQPFSFDDLSRASPFKHIESLPAKLRFWTRWEIYRVAQHTNMSPNLLYIALQASSECESPKYERLWKILGSVCRENGKTLPARSDIRPWMEESGSYESPDGKTAYFTFNLEYKNTTGPHIWNLVLNPIKVDKGNRIHRRFGADRHLMGFMNYFDKSSLPRWVTQRKDFNEKDAFEKIVSWIATETHHVVGRDFRAFYLEPEKTKTKRRTGEMPRQKLSLFAVDGVDFLEPSLRSEARHQAVSIKDFVNWHIPLHRNLHSTNLKLFSRFGLGLSKTKSTVELKPEQFRYLNDTEPVMNDGCALMSMSMGSEIWNICGDGTNDIPSAFQGRIGGSKGLWVIDYQSRSDNIDPEPLWIEVSDSQLKIKPHPRDRSDADVTQRSFEVLKWSTPCEPGYLNMQLINILADRGVPRSTLGQIVLKDIEEYIDASKAAMRDARQLQAWLQDFHRTDRNDRVVAFDDGLPEMKEEEARFLVESGFDAENCDHLRLGIISLMTQRLNTYVEKLRIQVPYSTTAFCVPDPYGVLEEDEIYLGFSRPWENPRTGLKEHTLYDLDVLVARNPAALASDIQKRKAVFKQELRHFKDVAVFSTKGSTPLASLLSGGDYDGDTVAILWEPSLVDAFENVQKPKLPTEEQCGLQKVSVKLADVVKGLILSDSELNEFLTTCIHFNAQPSRLGICTVEHEKLIYSGAKLSDPGSVLLATLAGYLVDANKQGLSQTESAWFKLRKAAQGGKKLLPLAYKSGSDRPRRWDNGECVNIIDHLKFDVAMERKQAVLVEFEGLLPNAKTYDQVLSAPYSCQYNRSINKNEPEAKNVALILEDLKTRLNAVIDEWQRRSAKRQQSVEKTLFASDIRHISAMIRYIKPLACDCDIYQEFLRAEKEAVNSNNPLMKGTFWSLLRASAMYKWYYRSRITWWAVGDELCRIKARSMGPTRELIPHRHHVLKADSKYIKRCVEESLRHDDDDDDDDDEQGG